jgi:hypothetical protein
MAQYADPAQRTSLSNNELASTEYYNDIPKNPRTRPLAEFVQDESV